MTHKKPVCRCEGMTQLIVFENKVLRRRSVYKTDEDTEE